MEIIETINNVECKLQIEKTKLRSLLDEKEALYCKYFPITQQIKQDVIKGGKKDNDKMAMYVHELNEVDFGNGLSLAAEIEQQQKKVKRYENYIKEMQYCLENLKGIEYELYYEIAINGVGISRAVSNIAERYNKEDYTIWKYHYSKIKKYIKNQKRLVKV